MHHDYWSTFAELIVTPFRQMPLIWGIVPLYFALLLGELTSAKANFRTAVQTGFSFLWAGAQWLYLYQKALQAQNQEGHDQGDRRRRFQGHRRAGSRQGRSPFSAV